MSQSSTEPEYSVEVSEKMHLTEKQLASLSQMLCDLEVDIQVLYKELTKLEGFSGRIADDIKVLALWAQER